MRGCTVDGVNVVGRGTAPSSTGHPRAYPEPPGAAKARRKRHGREPWRPLENPGAAKLPDRGGNHPAQRRACWRCESWAPTVLTATSFQRFTKSPSASNTGPADCSVMADDSLLISIVGVLGTLAGSGLTGFVSARSERRREAAAEQQAARQDGAQERAQLRELRAEHLRWQRERRQAAYLAFAAAVEDLRQTLTDTVRTTSADTSTPQQKTALAALLAAKGNPVTATLAAVRLEGPSAVGNAALEFYAAVKDLTELILRDLTPRSEGAESPDAAAYQSAVRVIGKADTEFIRAAESALDHLTTLD